MLYLGLRERGLPDGASFKPTSETGERRLRARNTAPKPRSEASWLRPRSHEFPCRRAQLRRHHIGATQSSSTMEPRGVHSHTRRYQLPQLLFGQVVAEAQVLHPAVHLNSLLRLAIAASNLEFLAEVGQRANILTSSRSPTLLEAAGGEQTGRDVVAKAQDRHHVVQRQWTLGSSGPEPGREGAVARCI